MSQANAAGASSAYRKPLPKIDVWNKPFWDATQEEIFLAQKDAEGNVWFPPSPVSPFTRSDQWKWVRLSGHGRVASWVVFHQKYFSGFAEDIPYNVALVELKEGPRIITNLVGLANEDIQIGMDVELVFRDATEHFKLPVFQPVVKGPA